MSSESSNAPTESQECSDKLLFLRNLIDGLPLAVFCKDYGQGGGKFVLWNKQAVELWGIEEKDVIGKTDYDFFLKEQADFFRQKDLETIYNGNTVFIKSEEAHSVSGKKTNVRTWKITLKDGEQPRYLIGISQNIMDFKKLEEEIFNQAKKIAHAEHISRKAEIAKQVAHDVNNPLAIILGRTNQLRRVFLRPHSEKEVLDLLDQSIANIKDSASRVNFLTRLLEEGHKETEGGESRDLMSESSFQSNSSFFHDMTNLLAIVHGKTNLSCKALKKDPSGQNEHLIENLNTALETLKRMQTLLLESRKKDDAA